MIAPKIIIKKAMMISCWIICLLSSCRNAHNVRVEYRFAPLIKNISEQHLAIGPIVNHSELKNLSQDAQVVLYDAMKTKGRFKQVIRLDKNSFNPPDPDKLEEFIKNSSNFDWSAFRSSNAAHLLLVGETWFTSQNRSGYDSEWAVNRYGYRVPNKVWVDRVSYEYRIRIWILDTADGTVLLDKEYKDTSNVEGSADEVATFISMTEYRAEKLLDLIQGKKAFSKRYLIE